MPFFCFLCSVWGQTSSWVPVRGPRSIRSGTTRWLWTTWSPSWQQGLRTCGWAGPWRRATARTLEEAKAGEETEWEMTSTLTALMGSSYGQVGSVFLFWFVRGERRWCRCWWFFPFSAKVPWPARWLRPTLTRWLRTTLSAAVWIWACPVSPSALTAIQFRACLRTLTWTVSSSLSSASLLGSSQFSSSITLNLKKIKCYSG